MAIWADEKLKLNVLLSIIDLYIGKACISKYRVEIDKREFKSVGELGVLVNRLWMRTPKGSEAEQI